jgi:RNA polymerase-binding transcription factor DksA
MAVRVGVLSKNRTVAPSGINGKRGETMGARKRPDEEPEAKLEANKEQLLRLAMAFGEEAGLHKPLADSVGGVIASIPEDVDLAQALSDRETTDLLVHLLDQNREQVERALERVREGGYGLCEECGHRIPAERLRYQPAATRCVECQGRWDRINGRTA